MVHRSGSTVDEYLAALPDDRRPVIEAVLELVRAHIPAGYREGMAYGMIGWAIPLEQYPDTYNGQPLGIVALGAQKHHNALYLSGPYSDPELEGRLRKGYAAAGKKLDMGKSCVRFKRLDQLVPEVLGEVIAAVPPDRFIEIYEAVRAATRGGSRTGRR